MNTNYGKLSADTLSGFYDRMGYKLVNEGGWHKLLWIDGAQLVTPEGNRRPVTKDMEIIFVDSFQVIERGSFTPVVNVTFTDGSTLSTFKPYWIKV